MMPIKPLSSLTVTKRLIPAHGLTPNTTATNRPLMIYRSVFSSSATASQIESHLKSVGVVDPAWRYTMYSFSHFHSTTHEILGIANGKAKLCFGHEDNSDRAVETLVKGDVIVVPAGVSHRLLEDLDGGFEMVGAYPRGCTWDMCHGKKGEEAKIEAIARLPWFPRDPVYGGEGPVFDT